MTILTFVSSSQQNGLSLLETPLPPTTETQQQRCEETIIDANKCIAQNPKLLSCI
jgi:hypothetical protein